MAASEEGPSKVRLVRVAGKYLGWPGNLCRLRRSLNYWRDLVSRETNRKIIVNQIKKYAVVAHLFGSP